MVRPVAGGRQVLGLLQKAVGQRLGMRFEVHQTDFGGEQIRSHPLWGKERPQAGVEAQAIPATQGALDERTKLIGEAFGNELFRQK